MKIVISPAKSLNTEDKLPSSKATQPLFLEEAIKINRKLSRYSKKELATLMKISEKLVDLNYERYQNFREDHNHANSRPAAYMFDGDVYQGLDSYGIETEKLSLLQDRLRILSGMYGLLRPLDLIQPYRLEMGTKLPLGRKKDLYEYWQEKITNALNDELSENELFINLASNEYFKSIDKKQLKGTLISPIFKDFKNGKLKVISFYAKKARGAMVRYIIDTEANSLEDIQGFNYDGYHFSTEETKNVHEPVFTR